MVLLVSSASLASTTYVVTNNDNPSGNSSSIYRLDTGDGALALVKMLNTGGVGNGGGFFASVNNTVTRDATCIYVYDGGSSDIAAFAVPSFNKVGNYSNPALNGAFPGGSMTLTPDGRFLYATYGGSANVGAWRRNADCSLTFIHAYVAESGTDTYSNILVDPSGRGVVLSVDDLGFLEFGKINQTTGALSELDFTNLNNTPCANAGGCFPTGLDINEKGVLVVGNAILGAGMFSAQLTGRSPYITNITYTDLTSSGLCNGEVPWFGADAYHTGSGAMYLGFSGFGAGCQSGVLTTSISGTTITSKKANQVTSASGYTGTIQSTGQWMVVSEWFNQLQVFKINNDGSITATAQGPVTDNDANGALGFFIYPPTR
jgi:6-phosphogluconolactonase (cycloisomerase 2 family)